ncbi:MULTISPECIES: L-histidine N(alpha)-methyltransferase [Sphingomonas]|uniref:L-histidine N(alpha)-methyltransferase n=1 Tax=Sphingomonas TaxID=13687 RepID=UPI000DEFC17A|nr:MULTISPECIES: L-histidine N(alpha)-methyltransferase [Sphingomonas]
MLATCNADPQFQADVLAGLAASPPAIPARWLYDKRGSELFEDITVLPEYYPTRTETALLRAVAPELARWIEPGRAVVEWGAGAQTKTPILLDAIMPAAYVPVDISGGILRDEAAALDRRLAVPVLPIEGDFTKPITLPAQVADHAKLGFFPGSTIGNFVPASATDLLRLFRADLGTGALLLIGFDRVKEQGRLVAAYDDAQGVTAAFDLNLLDRINRELEGSIPVDKFRHQARWNALLNRIEMHLVASERVEFSVLGKSFALDKGQSIHTENSHKYTPESAGLLLAAGGWTPRTWWTDPAGDFMLFLAEAEPERSAP